MPNNETTSVTPTQLFRMLIQHRKWWIIPAVAGFLLAAGYALVMPRKWQATQGVLIRAATGMNEDRLGKFADLSEMKTLQETILELARSKSVVSATLERLVSDSWFANETRVTPERIDDFRGSLRMNPPGGAEFGKTEVFYLGFVDKNPRRAAATVSILSEELDKRLRQLRDNRAQSMIDELSRGVAHAEQSLLGSIDELAKFEARVGNHLVDLRALESPQGGSSQLTQQANAIEAELRLIDEARVRFDQLLAGIAAASQDPQKLVALPASLLTSQPSLDRLKQGLVAAQLQKASLMGSRQPSHPFVQAAVLREQQVETQLRGELEVAKRGIEMEIAQTAARAVQLRSKLVSIRASMTQLADLRAPYSHLLSAVGNQTRLVEAAQKRLTDAQVTQAGAQSASLITAIDEVESGVRPVGAGRTTIAMAGGLAGLMLGLGLTFVVFDPRQAPDVRNGEVATPVTNSWKATAPAAAVTTPAESAPVYAPVAFVAGAVNASVAAS